MALEKLFHTLRHVDVDELLIIDVTLIPAKNVTSPTPFSLSP
jgi:hypothetical protein